MKTEQLLGFALALAILPAVAGTPYGIGGAGLSNYKLDAADTSINEEDTAFMLGAGYQINDTFSAELAFVDFGNMKKNITHEDADEEYRADANTVHLSVLAYLNFSEDYSFYGRLGVASVKWDSRYSQSSWGGPVTSTSDSGSDVKAIYGIGFQYALNQSLALRVEYDQINDIEDLSISAALAGITYKF